jgi:hypothetical protein
MRRLVEMMRLKEQLHQRCEEELATLREQLETVTSKFNAYKLIAEQKMVLLDQEMATNGKFSYDRLMRESDVVVQFFTGLTREGVEMQLRFLEENGFPENFQPRMTSFRGDGFGRPNLLHWKDAVILVMVQFKCDHAVQDIAHRFDISISTASRVSIRVSKLIRAFFDTLLRKQDSSKTMSAYCPDRVPVLQQEPFNNVMFIVDCFEVECEVPFNSRLRRVLFSQYKQRYYG